MESKKKISLNNLRPMLIKEILVEHTDEDHFMTVSDIINTLESDYGISTSRKTIYEDIDMLLEAGFDIECVKGPKNINKYHFLNRAFDVVELRVLIDAIESLKFLPLAKSKALVKKITRLAGPSAEYLINTEDTSLHPRTENNQIYSIIEKLSKAITSNRQVVFKYSEHLTSSKKPLKRESLEYQVSPYRLVCYHNYYYLIAYSEKDLQTLAFKTDCICDIPEILLKDSIPEPKGFSMESAACNN